MKQILCRLVLIEEQQKEVMEDLQKYLKECEDFALKRLSKHLSSEKVKARFTLWTLDEVPKVERSWEVTENQIMNVLSRRLREIIQQWEEDNQVFTNARGSLVEYFQQRYHFVEEQLRNLQGAVTTANVDVPQNAPFDSGLTVGKKVVIGARSPFWFPLGLVALIISTPVAGVLAVKKKLNDKQKDRKYEADKCAFMTKESAEYLDAANDENYLRPFVKDQLQVARLYLKQIEARVFELIHADKMLCEQLIVETRSKKEVPDLYHPLIEVNSHLRGQLALFRIQELRANDISNEELEWKYGTGCLGRGEFSAFYQGTLRTQRVVRAVALKVCNEVLDAKNASKVLAEVDLLR